MKKVSTNNNQMIWRKVGVTRPRFSRKDLALVCIVCILFASWLGYLYYVATPKATKDIVGVIRVEGPILTSSSTDQYFDVINQAMLNESVKAVVLVVDSPGGYADLIEQIYLDLLKLKERKPLVASVVMALSGGYYIAVAADYIYVHPSSFVGNIGVIGQGPPVLIPSEQVIESGAYKVTGFSEILFPYNLTHALDNFVSAVERGRENRLNLSSTHLRKGLVYLGSEAVSVGLADEMGSIQNATERAAGEADVVEYEAVELKYRGEPTLQVSSGYGSVEWQNLTIEALERLHPPPAVYYLYLPPRTFAQVSSSPEYPAVASSISAGRGPVLVDVSHGNRISWWELDILIGELAKRNVTVSFASRWGDIDSGLDNASCLIVAAPTEAYSAEEGNRIEAFVKKGRLLLLFFDPAAEYVAIPELFAPINSLSTKFGFSFAKGYLYNEVENFGMYRNIYVRNFASDPLTQNLRSLVLFTADHINSMGEALASTSNDTYSSVSEKAGSYATIVLVQRGNGTIVAFGDLTFLREPYCYVEDNYKLMMNLVSLVTSVQVPVEEVEEGVKEVAKPDLPVGTEKNFTEWVNGAESPLRWLRVNKTEVKVERPNRTTYYYFTENDALMRWVSDGMECIYVYPLPEAPYPLTKGERWKYESNYTLTVEGEEYNGNIVGEEEVEGFEEVLAEDNKKYFCARVEYTEVEQLIIDGRNMTMVTKGCYWESSEAGTVKQEATTRYYVDGAFTGEEKRTLLLKSIRKGQGA